MRRLLYLLLFFSLSQTAVAQEISSQLAVISDPDGWTNVRQQPRISADVVGRIYANEVFWTNPQTNNKDWVRIQTAVDRDTFLAGYIHNSRVRLLNLDTVPFSDMHLYRTSYFRHDSFHVEFTINDFQTDLYLIERLPSGQVLIDGLPCWGTDGNIPLRQIDSLRIHLSGKQIPVPFPMVENLFEPNPMSFQFYQTTINPTEHWFGMLNSDGAGYYYLFFRLSADKELERYIFRPY